MRVQASKIKHGSAVLDAGTTTKITSTQNINLADTSFTVEYWIKLNESALHRDHFSIGIRDTSTGWPTRKLLHLGYRLSSNGSTNMWFGFYADDASLPVLNRTEILKWQHHTFTYDSATKTKSIYLNGILIGTAISGDNFKGNAPLQIGQADTTTGINGCVDEVRVWNYARTAEQIKANYKTTIEPQTGLVAYYKLDGNALDSSGNGNHGTVNGGVTYSTTDIAPDLEKLKLHSNGLGGSAKFDDITAYVDCGSILQTTFVDSNPYSIEGWLKWDKGGCYFAKFNGGVAGTIQLLVDTTGVLQSHREAGAGTYIKSHQTIKRNVWTHVVFIYDGTQRLTYVNGVAGIPIPETAIIWNTQAARDIKVTIGCSLSNSLPTNYFGGDIGNFRVWNKALTQQEIQQNMYKILPATTPNLIEQWVLNGNALGTKGNHGTVTGNVLFEPDAPRRLLLSKPRGTVGQRSSYKSNIGSSISVPHFAGAAGIQSFTVETYVRVGTSTGLSTILSKSDSTSGFMCYKNGTAIRILVYGGGVGRGITVEQAPYSNKWVHLVFRYEYNTKVAEIIIDDVIVATTTLTQTTPFVVDDISPIQIASGYPMTYGYVRWYNGIVPLTELSKNKYSYLPANYPNLIEQWKLNEGIGNVAYGTKGNNGTITGATWTTPSLMNYVGKHCRFNGNYVTTSLPWKNKGAITIEFWAYQSSGNIDGQFVISNDTALVDGRVMVGLWSDGKIYWDYGSINTGDRLGITYNRANSLDKWVHYAFVASGFTGNFMAGYIDGVLAASSVVQPTSTMPNVNNIVIGDYPSDSAPSHYRGKLDGVRVWNTVRTQAEIQENMYRDIDRHPNLVLNMGFESGLWDASGHGFYGTAVGTAVIEVTDNDKLLLNAPINGDITYTAPTPSLPTVHLASSSPSETTTIYRVTTTANIIGTHTGFTLNYSIYNAYTGETTNKTAVIASGATSVVIEDSVPYSRNLDFDYEVDFVPLAGTGYVAGNMTSIWIPQKTV